MENTSNYGLKRWDGEDRILHTEFNDNWDKIDTAIKGNADKAAAALAAAGMVPAPGAMQQFYVLLPYAGALVAGISAVWALARMSRGGARLRSYVYEETVAKLPLRCLLTGVFAALAAVGECMDVFLNGGQGAIWYAVLFAALAAAAAAAAFAAGHTIRAAVYTEESDSGREE